jgi:hypothetical protein
MSIVLRRIVLCLLAGLLILLVAERRLSDGERHGPEDPTPALWEEARHPRRPPAPPVEQSQPGMVTPVTYAAPSLNCPFVLSVDRSSPYTLTSVEDGVRFDIDADGVPDQVSWTGAGSDVAFLALDGNGDGRITSGKELIGGQTLPGVRNGPNALIALANEALGGEPGAVVDSQNPLLFKLLLWTDANHNGISETAELVSAHHVVSDIGLGYQRHHREDRHGNESRYRGFVHVRTEPGLNRVTTAEEDVGRRRSMYDVCLVTR